MHALRSLPAPHRRVGQGSTMMRKKPRQSSAKDIVFRPTTRLELPDGSVLTIDTSRDADDPLQCGVQLTFTSGLGVEPGMNLVLPPHSIDVLVPLLQNMANQARYIMGEKMVEYPETTEPEKAIRKKKANKTD